MMSGAGAPFGTKTPEEPLPCLSFFCSPDPAVLIRTTPCTYTDPGILKGNRLQNGLAGAYFPAFHHHWNNHWFETGAEGLAGRSP